MTDDIFKFLVGILIGSTALVGIVVFLGKALLNHLLSKDIAQHKAQLQTEHAVALERLRSDLRLTAFEHETRFANLHERQAEIIAELYRRLVRLNRLMNQLTHPVRVDGESTEAVEKNIGQSGKEFGDYFLENQIYFDGGLCRKLESLHTKFWSALGDYYMFSPDHPEAKERIKSRWKAWTTINEEVPPILREIEDSFRGLLGHGERAQIKPEGKE